jgi:hypothetical protein
METCASKKKRNHPDHAAYWGINSIQHRGFKYVLFLFEMCFTHQERGVKTPSDK